MKKISILTYIWLVTLLVILRFPSWGLGLISIAYWYIVLVLPYLLNSEQREASKVKKEESEIVEEKGSIEVGELKDYLRTPNIVSKNKRERQ